MPETSLDALAARLRRELTGDVLFDSFSRGRYSTDASIYQIEPLGVVVPRTSDEAIRAAEIAAAAGVPILPRGAGTSHCGQTVGAALVIDSSKHVNRLLEVDRVNATAWVEPGIVLDDLNARLRGLGLWCPVDVSTSAQARIQVVEHDAGLDPGGCRGGVDVEQPIHVLAQVEDERGTDRLAALRGTGPARQDRHASGDGDLGGLDGLVGGARYHDPEGLDLIDRGIGRIAAAAPGVEQDFARELAPEARGDSVERVSGH